MNHIEVLSLNSSTESSLRFNNLVGHYTSHAALARELDVRRTMGTRELVHTITIYGP